MNISKTELYSPEHMFLMNNLRAIAITAVAYGHLIHYDYQLGNIASKFITLILMPIAMPLFSLISGFYHGREVREDRSSVSVIKIICLFLAGFIILYPLRLAHSNAPLFSVESIAQFFDVRNHSLLWYLISLMIWRFIAPVMIRVKYYMILVFLVGFASVFCPDSENYIKGGLRYMPFYFIGLSLSWEQIVRFRISKLKYLSLPVLAGALIFSFVVKYGLGIEVKPGDFNGGASMFSAFLICVAFYMLSISIISFLFAFASGRHLKIVSKIGTNCMSVYVLHLYIVAFFASAVCYPLLSDFGAAAPAVFLVQTILLFAGVYFTGLNFEMKFILNLSNRIEKLGFRYKK